MACRWQHFSIELNCPDQKISPLMVSQGLQTASCTTQKYAAGTTHQHTLRGQRSCIKGTTNTQLMLDAT